VARNCVSIRQRVNDVKRWRQEHASTPAPKRVLGVAGADRPSSPHRVSEKQPAKNNRSLVWRRLVMRSAGTISSCGRLGLASQSQHANASGASEHQPTSCRLSPASLGAAHAFAVVHDWETGLTTSGAALNSTAQFAHRSRSAECMLQSIRDQLVYDQPQRQAAAGAHLWLGHRILKMTNWI
jgi:hypothetical protein